MAAFHVGTIRPGTIGTAVQKVINFAAGKTFGVDEVQAAVHQYVDFFKDYQVSLVGSLDEAQECYKSDDELDFGDKAELDLQHNLQQVSEADVIEDENEDLGHVDHIPNTVKYSTNSLKNHFMFINITNVIQETVQFVTMSSFHSLYFFSLKEKRKLKKED